MTAQQLGLGFWEKVRVRFRVWERVRVRDSVGGKARVSRERG